MNPVPPLVLLTLLALAAGPAAAQGRLAFEAESLDLGRFAEADGPVTRTFRFTNAGDAPLRLTSVEASCGCTTPSWTEAVVAPGAGGAIDVAYDPAGRPGDFHKAVFVQAEGADAVTLRIEGVVRPAIADTGVRLGTLAFRDDVIEVGTVPAAEGFQTSFQFANAGERPVRVDSVAAPAGVEVVFPPRPVFPDKLGGFFVTGDAAWAARVGSGPFEVALTAYTDDADEPLKTVRVRGTLADGPDAAALGAGGE